MREVLQKLMDAIEDLDATMIEELIGILLKASDQEPMRTWSKQLKDAADEYDFERCEELTKQWQAHILSSECD